MLAFAGFLMFLGMVGAAVALIMLVLKVVFKRGWSSRRLRLVGALSVALFVVGLAMGWSPAEKGYEHGQHAARDEKEVKTIPASSPSLSVEHANNDQAVGQLPKPEKAAKETTTDKPSAKVQKERPPNVPELLQKDYKGIVQLLGRPTAEKTESADKKLIKYTLPGFELEITLFMDKPISMDITPLKEYKFQDSNGYSASDMPDDVIQLLYDLGFNKDSVIGNSATPTQRLFSYVDYGSPLREYEIRVNSEDWKAVSEGRASKVSWVYIKLIKTK
ncbi:hypothetical protein [Desulfotomaculum copahuensis]|uniref:Uncharacterized protein n=1 Tax=Desulfotomaculum copahuensis TaxID=1838280 RepID=A0A1B7LDC6_9FIRM|nr:hypothetical protein [Desulfotomaculum copahuensis]OAT81108.1 hypothetical protein A6M21_11905 [Desulfotomaculum copahuensis]